MMTSAPSEKEFHFAPTMEYEGETIRAATIEEATKIYHQQKRKLGHTHVEKLSNETSEKDA
ncbi:hypothetical protein [Rhodopseudomonas palustris]|uniref:hypothetical protein n=1 Tax=Rhodopseudomonas palustris TaxID=1076 RepID=UPI00131A8C90|nr:hypothetical protein [Rhodopseudomonas palustris]